MTTAVTIAPTPILAFLNNQGQPCVGGSLLTQVGGVNTATYQDSAGTIPLPNPIPLNNRGEISNAAGISCQLFLVTGTTYVFTLFDALGNQLNQSSYVSVQSSFTTTQLSALSGAMLVGFSQSSTPTAGTVGAKLQQIVAVTDQPYNAVCDGTTDDTTAATVAQGAAPYVFVPEGKSLFTVSPVNYQQFYGQGTMRMGSSTINLPPLPKTGGLVGSYNPLSFGSYENAVAGAFTINSANGQLKNNVQVNGTSGSGYATPVGQQRDHVALFVLAAPPTSVIAGASSTYTATTMTAAEIGAAGAGAILPGMVVDTKHATPYSGTVLSRSGSTITVDSWWLNGASPTAGTPASGTGATINPTTVTFAMNGVVSTTSTGTDAASGIELDMFAQNAVGANSSILFDAVGLGTFTALAGFRARSNWQIGFYSQGAGIAAGFVSDTTPTGFEARNVTGNGFQSRVSSVVKWAVNSLGNLSQDFRNTTINASATYAFTTSDVVVVNVSGGAVLTLPAVTGQAGRTITVNANVGCTVKNQAATTIKTLVGSTSAIFSCDGSFWY